MVTAVSPQRQVINADRNSQITVNFQYSHRSFSVNNLTFRVFAKLSGPVNGTFEFLNGNTQIKFIPALPFLAGEWITVSLSKGIRSQGNVAMEKGFIWQFWSKAGTGFLQQNPIRTIPVRRQGEGHIQCYGALGMDFNNDRLTDLAIVNEISRDFRIYLNNGVLFDTMHSVYSLPAGNNPSPSEAADFNHDGKVDIVIGNAGNNIMSLFIGTGNAVFEPEVPHTAANNVRGVAIGDLNGDGYDDIVTANRGGSNISIFINNGDGTFGSPVNINTIGNGETAVMLTDANNDGILDAFVGCYSSREIVLLLGDGNGSFIFSARADLIGAPWAIAIGDINGDGYADVAAALSSYNRIGVVFGNGSGGLSSVTTYNTIGTFPLAIDIGDLDGDNDLDLISSNYSGGNFNVYNNTGSGVFSNSPHVLPSSTSGSCITVHDRDNDGDLDLAGIDEIDDLLFIFDNAPGPSGVNPNSNETPFSFKLYQNFPNPFNPGTRINYDIVSKGKVMLTVYDILGNEVQILVNEVQEPGKYSVEFSSSSGNNYLPSGVYYYKLITDVYSDTKSMILLK
ncbi:MAG: T9SS type A sorting domain-containing protein [Ignavibacteria bacterium]|nr:T9SS type A sorting domain-containing protein [Ignavibacteria bacterium]